MIYRVLPFSLDLLIPDSVRAQKRPAMLFRYCEEHNRPLLCLLVGICMGKRIEILIHSSIFYLIDKLYITIQLP